MFDEKPKTISKNKKIFDWQLVLFIVLALVGIGVVAFGLHTLTSFSNQSFSLEACLPAGKKTLSEASNSASLSLFQGFIYIDLAGAVEKPGIYQLAVGSRLATAVSEAGGFTSQADPKYVSQELNLAQKLKDGAKIYIYSQVEREYEQSAAEFCQSLSTTSNQVGGDDSTQISINNAAAKDLETLEGIGEKRAADILENRPYQSLNELVDKEVLTESLFGKIQNQLKL